ncbi:hypothetical protein CBL_05861 [Carabus blaptoides fortunei]
MSLVSSVISSPTVEWTKCKTAEMMFAEVESEEEHTSTKCRRWALLLREVVPATGFCNSRTTDSPAVDIMEVYWLCNYRHLNIHTRRSGHEVNMNKKRLR